VLTRVTQTFPLGFGDLLIVGRRLRIRRCNSVAKHIQDSCTTSAAAQGNVGGALQGTHTGADVLRIQDSKRDGDVAVKRDGDDAVATAAAA